MYITICIVLIWDRAVPWALSASSVCPVLIIIIIMPINQCKVCLSQTKSISEMHSYHAHVKPDPLRLQISYIAIGSYMHPFMHEYSYIRNYIAMHS